MPAIKYKVNLTGEETLQLEAWFIKVKVPLAVNASPHSIKSGRRCSG
jgi:hypothetical protein